MDRVRGGDDAAFGGLWARHQDAGLRAARQISHRFDPEDLVQEAFTRVLSAIRGGKGPRDAFRPYLYASIRAVSMNWTRDRAKEHTLEDLSSQVDVDAMFEDVLLEQTVTGQAFKSLRPEWRTILWYTAVEGMSAREAGPLLGLSANAAAALAYRAREGLRVAWLQAHVSSDDADPACVWTVDRIGVYQRNGLRRKDKATFEEHLESCLKCTILVRETTDLASSLKAILLPIVLGSGIVSLDALGAVSLGGAVAGGTVAGGAVGSGGAASAGSTSVGSAAAASGAGTAAIGSAGAVGVTVASVVTASLVVAASVAAGIGWNHGGTPSPSAGQSVTVADVEDRPGGSVSGPDGEQRQSVPDAVPTPREITAAPSPAGDQPQPDAVLPRPVESQASPRSPVAESRVEESPVETPDDLTPPTPVKEPTPPKEPTPAKEPTPEAPATPAQPLEATPSVPAGPARPAGPADESEQPDSDRPSGSKPSGPGITITVTQSGHALLTVHLPGRGRGKHDSQQPGHRPDHAKPHESRGQGGLGSASSTKDRPGNPNGK
ncbi:sigma-70 family RNA polymerase sigma factor [Nocardioides sp. CCNWLW239]|uniref:RNA polymerase sigma factor n=1 Tax=Nocardioides sp. CCNWLW239 TaxID=3128902 RepID=UPI0030191927